MGETNFSTLVATTLTSAITGAVTGNVSGGIVGEVTYTKVARTTSADGTGAGLIADAGLLQFVTVTSGGANEIIKLPTPTPGTVILLYEAGTGYELMAGAPETVAINGNTPTAAFESAIPADSLVIVICASATAWLGITVTDATLASVEAANNT